MGRGGRQVVSTLAFYSDNLSSNSADVYLTYTYYLHRYTFSEYLPMYSLQHESRFL